MNSLSAPPIATRLRVQPAERPGVTRTPLVASRVALVEDLQSRGVATRAAPEDFSPDFQVCLPYAGTFVWQVGGDDVVADANQVLFVAGGEAFRLCQSAATPYAELIVTPDPSVLAALVGTDDGRLRAHALFRRRSRRAEPAVQLRLVRFLHAARHGHLDAVGGDEATLDLLRAALGSQASSALPSPASRRLVDRTKGFLAAHLSRPLRLADIARAVNASPAHLTTVFRRIEGVPLHRYLTQLRLARALAELPHSRDLTALALSVGFSSHSHFAASFRRAFGVPPSRVRDGVRPQVS
jgi:AraC-like DNA-binding protein